MVGHDWGAAIAWYLCLFRPDRVKALVNLSVHFRPRHPSKKPVETMRALLGENYYICRFQVLLFLLCMFGLKTGCTSILIMLVAWKLFVCCVYSDVEIREKLYMGYPVPNYLER